MEKRKLRRTCQGWACGGRILDVDTSDGWVSEEYWQNTVRWTEDPYDAEINEDHPKMWLCGKCQEASRDEI